MLLTEAEQLSLSRARRTLNTNLEMILEQIPDESEEFVTEDVVAAALLALCGRAVSTYLMLVKSFAQAKTEMED